MGESKTTDLLTVQEVIEKVRSSNDITAAIYINGFAYQAMQMRAAVKKDVCVGGVNPAACPDRPGCGCNDD